MDARVLATTVGKVRLVGEPPQGANRSIFLASRERFPFGRIMEPEELDRNGLRPRVREGENVVKARVIGTVALMLNPIMAVGANSHGQRNGEAGEQNFFVNAVSPAYVEVPGETVQGVTYGLDRHQVSFSSVTELRVSTQSLEPVMRISVSAQMGKEDDLQCDIGLMHAARTTVGGVYELTDLSSGRTLSGLIEMKQARFTPDAQSGERNRLELDFNSALLRVSFISEA
ncbi:hypothetical protein HY988_02375 [Candidatus Micrarchaeota archaeon]|nr:hypothetical protein [Candidatus Micrarchaeota archaeon]